MPNPGPPGAPLNAPHRVPTDSVAEGSKTAGFPMRSAAGLRSALTCHQVRRGRGTRRGRPGRRSPPLTVSSPRTRPLRTLKALRRYKVGAQPRRPLTGGRRLGRGLRQLGGTDILGEAGPLRQAPARPPGWAEPQGKVGGASWVGRGLGKVEGGGTPQKVGAESPEQGGTS